MLTLLAPDGSKVTLRPRVCGHLCPRGFGSLAPGYSVTCAHIRPTTGESGEGGGRGGDDNDLVSRGMITTSSTTTSAPQRVRGGREGEGAGMLTALFHAASTTTSVPQRVRGGREGEGGGMITTLFHAASTITSSHPRNGHTNDFVGGCFMCPDFVGGCFMCQGTGEGGRGRHLTQVTLCTQRVRSVAGEGGLGRAGRLQASDPREAFHARPQVSCF